jgi:hypothetical protein
LGSFIEFSSGLGSESEGCGFFKSLYFSCHGHKLPLFIFIGLIITVDWSFPLRPEIVWLYYVVVRRLLTLKTEEV